MIFRKLLHISPLSLKNVTVGQMVAMGFTILSTILLLSLIFPGHASEYYNSATKSETSEKIKSIFTTSSAQDNNNDSSDSRDIKKEIFMEKQDTIPLANSTLGFEKIYYISVPGKDNQEDAIILQSSLTGLQVEKYEGVDKSKLFPAGLPPSSRKNLPPGVIACYRAHANVWREMLKQGLNTVFILEGDAAWDMNVRAMMPEFAVGFEKMLKFMNFINKDEKPTKEDPYMSNHWDMISFGSCFFEADGRTNSVRYHDPYVHPGLVYFGDKLKDNERVVRYRARDSCTTAYAVSRRGAQKLLSRHDIDLDGPVDMVMQEMIRDNYLDQYAVFPTMFFQWKYNKNIGEQKKNTDINNPDAPAVDPKVLKETWSNIHKTYNVWDYSDLYRSTPQKDPVLYHLMDNVMLKGDAPNPGPPGVEGNKEYYPQKKAKEEQANKEQSGNP